MALAGAAVLAIWNDVVAGFEQEFEEWHVREHIPERVALPGWLRGRRYEAVSDAQPRYFNFYETIDTGALLSAAYRARLDDPTSWTRAVVSQFTNTVRTLCDVEYSAGFGSGGAVETIRFGTSAGNGVAHDLRADVLDPLTRCKGITGVHLLRRSGAGSMGGTAETALRGPDREAGWIALIEAIGPEPLLAARDGITSDHRLPGVDGPDRPVRGLYRLQYDLTSIQSREDAR